MKIATPSLDRLTAEVKDQFLARVNEAEFRVSSSTGLEHILSAASIEQLRAIDPSYVAQLIRNLHGVDGLHTPYPEVQETALRSTARQVSIPEDLARELLDFVSGVKWAIRALTTTQMEAYKDSQAGAVLVDFLHIGYEEFDPMDRDNALDYSADDNLPQDCETPHNHVLDLVRDAVAARLIKRHGRELTLAWVNAQSGNK
jgi:hypothetical protein